MLHVLVAGLLCAAVAQPDAAHIVSRLRGLPAGLPAAPRSSDGKPVAVEQLRNQLYGQLRMLGAAALPALGGGLRSDDVRLRRNVALALNALSSTWYSRSEKPLDIVPLLPTLITALKDDDGRVAAWSAQAIGNIGSQGAAAVPALTILLETGDEGRRNSACIALRAIGPLAKDALPALRRALLDPSADVRGFARRAIAAIEDAG